MSDNVWQQYIDSSLIGSGSMHSAAIVSKADGGYWAYGGDYVPQPDEVAKILKALKEPDAARAGGVMLAGSKYFTLRAEPELIYAKLGAGGLCVAGAAQCAIIGVYGEGTNPADCNIAVEGIAKYLKDQGY
jgi:profilin